MINTQEKNDILEKETEPTRVKKKKNWKHVWKNKKL